MEEGPHPARVTSEVGLRTLAGHPPRPFRQRRVWGLRKKRRNRTREKQKQVGFKKDNPVSFILIESGSVSHLDHSKQTESYNHTSNNAGKSTEIYL